MSMFARFTPAARQAMVRAGLLSVDAGRHALDEDVILLALAETRPFENSLPAGRAGEGAGHAVRGVLRRSRKVWGREREREDGGYRAGRGGMTAARSGSRVR
ncbi:hypothetical protein [Sphaerisporangium perillae]|uniref:hypothetical protein n=1 Tax=Sphaerisporangium perillae TaxID=2935860 RepID=UPI00200CD99C|nr:hypothetical protein [Sphaerisporangium perillae]